MNPIIESNINKRAPYTTICKTDSVALFMTDHGLVYEAGFVEDFTFFDENAYQFYLKEITGTVGPRDSKVMLTVGAIIEEFLSQNDSVVVYICDDSDGKQAIRNRLFIGWYNTTENHNNYTLLTGGGTINGCTYFAAAIVAKKNPDYEDIINAFAFFKMEIRAKFPNADIE